MEVLQSIHKEGAAGLGYHLLVTPKGLSLWQNGKESSANEGDTRVAGSIPGLGRSFGGGNGNPLQYSCLENSMDRQAWWATVHGVTKSWT